MSSESIRFSSAYQRYVTWLLLVVYIFNQVDRGMFGILMEPIKRELELSDAQLGFLAGPALVVFYALLGVPVARWADRGSRVGIMSLAVFLWSVIVSATAVVGTFWQMALTRFGVGVGEAGFSAVAQSLIGDYHRERERARALSTFMLAIPLGGAVSSLMGGWLNELYGWRLAFVVAGLSGLPLAALIRWTIREPPRRGLPLVTRTHGDLPALRSVWPALWKNPTLRHLAIALGLVNVVVSTGGWTAVFFMRNHHLSSGELGTWFAATGILGSAFGVWLGGYLMSRRSSRDGRFKLRLMSVATASMPVFGWAALWVPSAQWSLLLFIPTGALLLFSYGPTFALVNTLSPANMRATMAAMFMLIQLLGAGFIGVQLVGFANDLLMPVAGSGGAALRWTLTFTDAFAIWSAAHFWMAGRGIRMSASPGAEEAHTVSARA